MSAAVWSPGRGWPGRGRIAAIIMAAAGVFTGSACTFVLAADPSIEGIVQFERRGGPPVENVAVAAKKTSEANSTVTGADGRFRLTYTSAPAGSTVSGLSVKRDGYVVFNEHVLAKLTLPASGQGELIEIFICHPNDRERLFLSFYGHGADRLFAQIERSNRARSADARERAQLQQDVDNLKSQVSTLLKKMARNPKSFTDSDREAVNLLAPDEVAAEALGESAALVQDIFPSDDSMGFDAARLETAQKVAKLRAALVLYLRTVGALLLRSPIPVEAASATVSRLPTSRTSDSSSGTGAALSRLEAGLRRVPANPTSSPDAARELLRTTSQEGSMLLTAMTNVLGDWEAIATIDNKMSVQTLEIMQLPSDVTPLAKRLMAEKLVVVGQRYATLLQRLAAAKDRAGMAAEAYAALVREAAESGDEAEFQRLGRRAIAAAGFLTAQ